MIRYQNVMNFLTYKILISIFDRYSYSFTIFAVEFLQRQGNRLLKIAEAERCPNRVRSAF